MSKYFSLAISVISDLSLILALDTDTEIQFLFSKFFPNIDDG